MKKKYPLLLIAILVCFAITLQVYRKCLVASKRSLTYGSAAAINAALLTELDKGNSHLEEIFSSSNQQWSFLTANEYDGVIIELAKSHNLDPPRGWETSVPLVDPWGNRFEIGHRKLSDRHYDLVVVSKGVDAIYGTKDDVVSGNSGVSPPMLTDMRE